MRSFVSTLRLSSTSISSLRLPRSPTRIMATPTATSISHMDILNYWLGPAPTNVDNKGQSWALAEAEVSRWFRGGSTVDEEIKTLFAPLIEDAVQTAAATGTGTDTVISSWLSSSSSLEHQVAAIIVCDQFTR